MAKAKVKITTSQSGRLEEILVSTEFEEKFDLRTTVIRGEASDLNDLAEWVEDATDGFVDHIGIDSFTHLTDAQIAFAEKRIRGSMRNLARELRRPAKSAEDDARPDLMGIL